MRLIKVNLFISVFAEDGDKEVFCIERGFVVEITSIKINNLKNPKIVNIGEIFFSWNIKSNRKNVFQEKYKIEVWSENLKVWDSDWKNSNKSMQVLYEGKKLKNESKYILKIFLKCSYKCEIENEIKFLEISGESKFETGVENWDGYFIGETNRKENHIYLKNLLCEKKINNAKIYICGLGQFELYLNGDKVSDYVFEPAWSNYDKTCYYTSYDLSEIMKQGNNNFIVKLGDGMFNVPGYKEKGRYVYYERSYGLPKFICKILVDYEDGTKEILVSDESWKIKKSPIVFSCIYGGEEFDSRLWEPKEFNLENLENAKKVEFPKGELVGQINESLKVMETYEPIEVKKINEDTYIYDLGKNFSGVVKIKIKTNKKMSGHKIIMTPAEILDENNLPDQRVTGKGYSWDYILNSDESQEYMPNFTYTGFRYLMIKGISLSKNESLPLLKEVTGEFIYPELKKGGEFSCSEDLFNNIHKIIKQAMLSNTKSYFTDCPHREKLGWLEETHLIGPSLMYNLEVQALYNKIEQDMCDSQRKSGLVPDICPEYVTGFEKWHEGFVDSPEWGSAIIINPWYVYKRYGDDSLLKKYYDNMKKYLSYLTLKTHHNILHHGLGDWLDIGPMTPHSQNTPVPVVATSIYYYDLKIMSEVAKILGKESDLKAYEHLKKDVYKEYNLQFLDKQTGRYATGSQTAQALSLVVGLVPKEFEKKVLEQLKQDIIKRNYAITSGDVGHPFLVRALIKYGMEDILNKMLLITDKPGYGYQVVNGATTLTEEWDGPEPNNAHGSQNHFMLGSIEEYFFGSIGGIDLFDENKKIDEVIIKPYFAEGLEWAKASIIHSNGIVEVSWSIKKEEKKLEVVIPPNTLAYVKNEDGDLIDKVGSGTYIYNLEKVGQKQYD